MQPLKQHYNLNALEQMERFYRTHFINSLTGFKSATLIGTAGADGQPNLAIFSNVVHVGARPALVGFVNRPLEAAPHTLANIQATGYYTMNLITAAMAAQAHQTSAKYAVGESEFEATGFTPLWQPPCPAPLVAESPVQYIVQLEQVIPLQQNDTFFVLGAIQQVWVQPNLVQPDGFIALEKAGIVTSLGIDGYYSTNKLQRYAYAKPGILPRPLVDDGG